jgi:hypothetical protein
MIAALIGALGSQGCSLVLQEKLRDHYAASEVPACTGSSAIAALDGLLGAAYGVTGIALAAGDEDQAGEALAAIGIAYVLSGLSGAAAAHRCRDARRSHQRWVLEAIGSEQVAAKGHPPLDPAAAETVAPAAEEPAAPAAEKPADPAAEEPAARTPPAEEPWGDFWAPQ